MPIRDRIADAFERSDSIALSAEDSLRSRIIELLFSPEERDIELWVDASEGISVDASDFLDLTPSDLNEVDLLDRDVEWISTQATMIAAATQQARLEIIYRPLLRTSRSGAEAIVSANKRIDNEQRITAAKEGVGQGRFDAARRRIIDG